LHAGCGEEGKVENQKMKGKGIEGGITKKKPGGATKKRHGTTNGWAN
jgi:hypothetical protein